MNDDFDFNPEQNVKALQKEKDCKGTLNFLKSTQERQLGINGKLNLNSVFHLQARAEDELVKKEFKEMRCEMPGLTRSTFLMVFSPDGTKVASTHGNHNIYVTDVRTGKHIKTLVGHPRTPWCIAFHPVSNQIIASGCLGGQVRIWDLTGGSEVWTAETQTVIASIAFHPDNRLLVIATCNQLHFWDWSKAEPFMHVETGSTKEKLRYVAFDKLGHKLITGITNSPQTRWERVRAPVPVSRPADRSASPYRRRITPRLITSLPTTPVITSAPTPTTTNLQSTSRPSTSRLGSREPWYSLPERERSIGTCYRDLLREYEVLVHRYLQIYRPPVMIDQGTDPMDINTPRSTASTSNETPSTSIQPAPSTSEQHRSGPGTSRDGLRKKSSASQPAKNRKMNYFTDSSSSSNTSPTRPEVAKSSEVGAAAVDDIEASLSSSSPQKLPGTSGTKSDKVDVKIKIDGNDSSSDDDDDNKGENAKGEGANKVPEAEEEDKGKEFDVYKYLNLARRCDSSETRQMNNREIAMTKWLLVPITTAPTLPQRTTTESRTGNSATKSTQSNQTESTTTSTATPQAEPVYKMMIKCSVTPGEGSSTAAEAAASTSNPEPSTSTAQNSDKISVLIRNAELMLAKFRENLEQRGHLSGLDLPTTSRSLLNNQKKKKPSKGTNTNESDTRENVRKRALKQRPVIDYSTDISSSDDEQKTKRVCSEKKAKNVKTEHTYAANAPSTSNDHNYADNLNNEHSYAGLTEGNPPDSTVRIKINLSSVRNEEAEGNAGQINQEPSSDSPPRPINFNAELELLVTDLLANGETSTTTTSSTPTTTTTTNAITVSRETTTDTDRFCNTCGGSLEERNQRDNGNTDFPTIRCIRTNFCNRNSLATTRTTNTTTSPSSDSPRRRFFSHRLSAFYPTRLNNQRMQSRLLRSSFQPLFSSRLGIITEGPRRSPSFAPDEVINYAERVNEEEAPRAFHPFDPPTEMINPEIFGIGNMYSNIVQELESSLNDLWSIRANRRLGETSDMLSSFSERLESIMTQSNAILRNLSNSLDSLSQTENGSEGSSDSSRFNRRPNNNLYTQNSDDPLFDLINSPLENRRNASTSNPITSEHNYPLNPENPSQSSNISPLMFSLKLTVSHIQRQARLLRQQVESIERIDRAMLEVAQLQMIRQMFDRLRRHFSQTPGLDARIGVSSVRQMMAGTRISDSSSPYDSPNEDAPPQNSTNEARPSTSDNAEAPPQRPSASQRARTRKTYPRCLFLMNNRQQRRTNPLSLGSRRTVAKERVTRRNMFRRFLASRSSNRATLDMTGRGLFNIDTLNGMTRRLEHFLMEHGRYIGRPTDQPHSNLNTLTDLGEHIMMLRLNNCRERMNSILGNDDWTSRHELSSVTVDGSSRLGARQTLSHTLDNLSRYLELNNSQQFTPIIRAHLWEIIELSLLLSEILLLQIVDSIPQTSGMNLDPERESLSSRIDQMCSRMLTARENRSPTRVSAAGHSLQLTRSLRLLRMTVSHANQALGQTYTSRRNAMLPTNNDNENLNSRQELLDNINNCLRNIRRHRENSIPEATPNPARGEWERVIRQTLLNILSPSHDQPNTTHPSVNFSPTTRVNINSTDINTQLRNIRRHRIRGMSNSENIRHNPVRREWERILVPWLYNPPTSQDGNRLRNSSGANPMICPNPSVLVEDANSSDDNTTNSNSTRERIARPLYRTSNVNLLHNEESNPSGSRSRMWNVPTVLLNDVPINEAQFSPWHPRFRPMFLHPLHAGVNPLNADWDDPHREQIYDSDIITTVTPNQRIQVWEFSEGNIPSISDALENVVVNECKIHNDASVDYASDGSILVTLLPSGGYMNITNRLGVYSLDWKTLGQCLYVTSFEQNAVSVSLSPLNRHLVVGLASRRVSIMPSDKWTMARIFLLDYVPSTANDRCAKLSPIRELEQSRDTSYMSVNCIRWLPTSGQGLAFATNTGHLRFLT